MLRPINDSKLKQEIYNILVDNIPDLKASKANELVVIIAEKLNKRGYHVGLPSDIEWALNSGKGVYKP